MSKVVLITGASGFLGYHLCLRFLKEKFTVIGVDNHCTGLKTNSEELIQKGVHFINADVSKSWKDWTNELEKKVDLKKVDFVLHFASPASPPVYQQIPLKTMAANSLGLWHSLTFAQEKNSRVVFASTSEVYGSPEVSPQPESYWGYTNSFGPRSCYDEAKRFGEALIYSYNQENKTKHGLVRIFNTYGPRMDPKDGRVIINFLMQLKEGSPLTVHGDGTQTRSFCYVDDLVDGIYKYTNQPDLCEPMNLGNEKEFTILELAQEVQKLSEKKLEIKFEARPVDDPPRRRPDIRFAQEKIGWNPSVELLDGLKRMLDSL